MEPPFIFSLILLLFFYCQQSNHLLTPKGKKMPDPFPVLRIRRACYSVLAQNILSCVCTGKKKEYTNYSEVSSWCIVLLVGVLVGVLAFAHYPFCATIFSSIFLITICVRQLVSSDCF